MGRASVCRPRLGAAVSLGLRDQRVRVYTYASTGDADGAGIPQPTYTYAASYWGRVEAPRGLETAVGRQSEHVHDLVVSLSDEATIPENGALLVKEAAYAAGDTLLKVVAVLPRRLASEIQVLCQSADDAGFTVVDP